MTSRMDRYNQSRDMNSYRSRTTATTHRENNPSPVSSRERKNQRLYKEVSQAEIENFDVNSNVSIIGNNSDSIDIDKIKDMLDKKYRVPKSSKSIADDTFIDVPKVKLDETREYNLKDVIKQAKQTKENNYEEDRLKKLRNTQYDILKDLKIYKDEEIDDEEDIIEDNQQKSKTEKKLVDLINTITEKELIQNKSSDKELNPLDILSDLCGDDENTQVLGANELSEDKIDVIEVHKTKKIKTIKEELEEQNEEEKDEDNVEKTQHTVKDLRALGESLSKKRPEPQEKKKKTNKLELTDSFDDFSDLKDDSLFVKILVRIIIILIVLLFIAACVFFANKYFDLGLF